MLALKATCPCSWQKMFWRDLSITFLSSGCSLARLSRYDDGLALLKSFSSIISPSVYTPILIVVWAVSKELTIFPGYYKCVLVWSARFLCLVALMKFYEGVAPLSNRVSSAFTFRLCWSSGACRSAVHPTMRGVDLRARTVARNWKESRPREARPEDSSIYIYIYIYKNI